MYFSELVVRNLTRRPARVLLVILGSAIAVAAMVSLVGVSEGFSRSFASILQDRGIDIVVLEDKKQQMNSRIPEFFGSSIKTLARVEAVEPTLVDVIALENTSVLGVPVSGWRPESYLFEGLQMISGKSLAAGDRKKAILGQGVAETTGKFLGDRIDLEGMEFEVAGVYTATNLLEQNGIIISLPDMQELVASPGSVTGFSVKLKEQSKSLAEVQRVVQEIEKLPLPAESHCQIKVQPTDLYLRNSNEIQVAKAMAWLTSMISLIVGAIGMFNAMLTFVYERTREFGILRALGWKQRRLIGMVLSEACCLSIIGSLVGVILAIVVTKLLSYSPQVRGFLDGNLSLSVILRGILIGTLVGLLGGLYPAYHAGKMLPSEVIRHE
jgi:putative ABC transport system permease protein